MSDPFTPFLQLTKPIVNDEAGEDLWGDKLNLNFDKLDEHAETISVSVGTKIEDAPKDGQIYGRIDGSWSIFVATSIDWAAISNKPDTFPPTLPIPESGVTDLVLHLNTLQGAITANTSAIGVLQTDKENVILPGTVNQWWRGDKTWQTLPAATWGSITGKPTTFPPDPHQHPISDVTNLQTTLDNKEPKIATGNAAYVWHGDKTWKAESPFPEAPADGQLYSRKGSTASWIVASAGAVVSDSPPTGMPVSTIWWNSSSGGLFIDYQDPNSRQWVMVNAAGMPEANKDGKTYGRKDGGWTDISASLTGFLPLTGGTISGNLTVNNNFNAGDSNITGKTSTYALVVTAKNAASGAVYGDAGGIYGISGYNGYSFYGNGALYTAGAGAFGGALSTSSTLTVSNVGTFNTTLNVLGGLYVKNSQNIYGYGGGIYLYDSGGGGNYAYLSTASGCYSYPIFGASASAFNGRCTGSGAGVLAYNPAASIYGAISYAGYGLYTPYLTYMGGPVAMNDQCIVQGILQGVWAGANTTTNSPSCWIGSNGTFYRSTSSLAHKTAIETMEDAYADKVLDLQPIFYRPGPNTVDNQEWSRFGLGAEHCYATDFRFSINEPGAHVGHEEIEEQEINPDWTEWTYNPDHEARGAEPPMNITFKRKGPAIYNDTVTPIANDLNAIVAALLSVVKRQNSRIAALEAALGV